MILHDCTEADLPAIREIFNDAILNTTALYEYEPRSTDRMHAWFAAKNEGSWPVIGAYTPDGILMGFSSYGPFRPQPGFSRTVEHSVYVQNGFRGQGLGKVLLQEALSRAKVQDYHLAIGALDSENTASIRLHEALGFSLCATIPESGRKFDRWLTLVLYQKKL